MFTGIIEEMGQILLAQSTRLTISAERVPKETSLGDSIAVNGVCLTITNLSETTFGVDLMPETVRRTNLGILRVGEGVNLERPLTLSGRLGGHLVQGHVDGIARLAAINQEEDALIITFEAPPDLMRYIVEKGFIAVDGISLTVVARKENSFQVSIVNYTREHTNIGQRRVGDITNIEVDIIGKYIERLMPSKSSGITLDFLREHGFLGVKS